MTVSASDLDATHLRGNVYAVRPKGQLGTCGYHPYPWTVEYVRARDATSAIQRALAKGSFDLAAQQEIADAEQWEVTDDGLKGL